MRAPDEHTKLARIAVSFSPALDEAFKVNVAKMRVQIPASVREDLTALVQRPALAGQQPDLELGRARGADGRGGCLESLERLRELARLRQALGPRERRLDPGALAADLTIAVSAQPADYKIYVRSASFSEQDAAALFAVIWRTARKAGLGREFAERH